MMRETLRAVITLSFIGGAALWLCPECGVKRVMRLLCTAILAAAVLAPLRAFDYDALDLAQARFAGIEEEIVSRAAARGDSLKDTLFIQNCERYLRTKAESLGLRITAVWLELETNGEERLPYAVTVEADGSAESAEALGRLISDELGIPAERQVWRLREQD